MVEKKPIYKASNDAKVIQHVGSIYATDVTEDITVPRQEGRVVQSGKAIKSDRANVVYTAPNITACGNVYNALYNTKRISFRCKLDSIGSFDQRLIHCGGGGTIRISNFANTNFNIYYNNATSRIYSAASLGIVAGEWVKLAFEVENPSGDLVTTNTITRIIIRFYVNDILIDTADTNTDGDIILNNNPYSLESIYTFMGSQASTIADEALFKDLRLESKKISTGLWEDYYHFPMDEGAGKVAYDIIGTQELPLTILNAQSDTWTEDEAISTSYVNDNGYSKIYITANNLYNIDSSIFGNSYPLVVGNSNNSIITWDANTNTFRVDVNDVDQDVLLDFTSLQNGEHTVNENQPYKYSFWYRGNVDFRRGSGFNDFVPYILTSSTEWQYYEFEYEYAASLIGVKTYLWNSSWTIPTGSWLEIKDLMFESNGIIPMLANGDWRDKYFFGGILYQHQALQNEKISVEIYNGRTPYNAKIVNQPCLTFDKANSTYLTTTDTLGNLGILSSSATNWGVGMWLNLAVNSEQVLFHIEGNPGMTLGGSFLQTVGTTDNKPDFRYWVTSDYLTRTEHDVEFGKDFHIGYAIRLDGGTYYTAIYINGIFMKEVVVGAHLAAGNYIKASTFTGREIEHGSTMANFRVFEFDNSTQSHVEDQMSKVYQDLPTANDLIWCPMQESGGTTIYDISSNSNPMAIANAQADLWSNTQDGYTRSALKGYNLVGGVKIPVQESNVYLDALGNTASHPNPEGRKLLEGIDLKLNPNGAPALAQAGIPNATIVSTEYDRADNILFNTNILNARDLVLYDNGPSLPESYWTSPAASAQKVIAKMTLDGSTPTLARQNLISQLILDLSGKGTTGTFNVWGELDAFLVYSAEDEIQGLVDWKRLISAQNVPKTTTSLVHTADYGFVSAGVAYMETFFVPSTDGVNYTQNSACLGVDNLVSTVNEYTTGVVQGASSIWIRIDADGAIDTALNSTFNTTGSFASDTGVKTITRNDSTTFKLWDEDVLSVIKTRTSGGVPSLSISDFGYHSSSANTTNNQSHALWFAGGGELENHMTQFVNSYNKYKNAL
jgi:hypothetical protein